MKNCIGIIGGGHLGRMLTLEAKKMGFYVTVLDPIPHSLAGQVADKQIVADFKDEKAVGKLAKISDYLTFEIELANLEFLDGLAQGVAVNPSVHSLTIIKDKLSQKQFLRKHHIPTTDFVKVASKDDLLHAARDFGFPLVLKARIDAYKSGGNAIIKNKNDIDCALEKLKDRELYVEKFVQFKKELVVMVARNIKGQIEVYPVVETIYENNISQIVFSPARVNSYLAKKAENLAKQVMNMLKGVGIFGIKMFLTKDNSQSFDMKKLMVNQITAGVNSCGYYSLKTCVTNQFEQHIRAITGMSLGKTDLLVKNAVMINLLGQRTGRSEVHGLEKALVIPGVFVHIYGKKETKIDRKMGHLIAIGTSMEMAWKKARQARKYISI